MPASPSDVTRFAEGDAVGSDVLLGLTDLIAYSADLKARPSVMGVT